MTATRSIDTVLATLPLIPPIWILLELVKNESEIKPDRPEAWTVESQLLAYVAVAVVGFLLTNNLVPNIKTYTLRKGLSGKDLGKKGTPCEDLDVPEALGIVPGAIFLICLIFCLVGYATSNPSKLLDCNSALLSICFMLFLGFTDDVLDWPWRYKLLLPSVATLPLLCCYKGSTSIVVPIQLRALLMQEGALTSFGRFLCCIITVDENANGAIINLGFLYLVYMGLLAVFCTNAINIYAGINGLEAGQSYVIGCAVLLHNMLEIRSHSASTENHLFSAMLMLSFVGVTMGLLRHNWFPALVFVGDTYCYFAGMTFAVVGILGHFSKTLLLFFIPQILNFLWSTPQLFKFVPCPRHRLPRMNVDTGCLEPSTFRCKGTQFRWLKFLNPGATEVANMTLINVCLQIFGPMKERTLCVVLLAFQVLCCGIGLFIRYYVAQFFFDK
mmetsp:Transcript_36833/g.54105  ORF Transcript_36833/g.54105 Transcript_36833/m.54105 type:complete len:443 (-) Transcript_36833:184-1512(-)